MKILKGAYKGVEITAPETGEVRPTVDHFKKHIIRIFEDHKPKIIWDLFAGSGGVGLEFLSLGASQAVFVEQLKKATACLNLNLAECRFKNPELYSTQNIQVVLASAESFLKNPDHYQIHRTPNLVFLDPPYGQNIMHKVTPLLLSCPLIDKNTIIVAEHVQDDPLPNLKPDGELVSEEIYGPKTISIFRKI